MPVLPAANPLLELICTLLPLLDLKVVADGDVVEPVRAIFFEPDMAVLVFQGRVGVTQVLAAAKHTAYLVQDGVGGRALRCVMLLGNSLGIRSGDLLGELELEADEIEAARTQVHGRESVSLA